MKKGILTLTMVVIFAFVTAQSFKLYFKGVLVSPDTIISVKGNPESGAMVLDALAVSNLSPADLNVRCACLNIETVPGTENSFLWGLTDKPMTDTSNLALVIRANKTSGNFKGNYVPHGNAGTTKVKYVFYNQDNPQDNASVQVHYDFHLAPGMDEPEAAYTLSHAYPNPANSFVSFVYDFQGAKSKTSLVIYDLLGSPVKNIDLTAKSGELKIDTSELKDGIYFYSLVMDHKTIETHKLFVKHS